MKVCCLTYDVPHKKTAEVAFSLMNRGVIDVSFLFVPFTRRPERTVVFPHRPFQFSGVSARSIATRYGLQCFDYDRRHKALDCDWLLVCGSNILEPKFANSGKIINAHAGLIPLVRGLDSFKWSIHDLKPLGNTLHIIDENADKGVVLHHMPTPVFAEDDIATLAERHYRNEIWLLQNFDLFLKGGDVLKLPTGNPTKRMPIETEADLVRRLDDYKEKFCDSQRPSNLVH